MENGLAVAKFLENHKAVEKVIYPGIPFTFVFIVFLYKVVLFHKQHNTKFISFWCWKFNVTYIFFN